MNKEKIYDNLVRTVRANVVEKLKTFSQKGLAADLNIPYAYITWIGSSKSGLWFQIPKFYIYVLAIKLTIMIPEELMGEKAEEFTKRNVKIDGDGNFTFSKTHHSGSRKKQKVKVTRKELPDLTPRASFDMKPKGDKVPDLASKSKTGAKPGYAGIPSPSQAQTVPAKEKKATPVPVEKTNAELAKEFKFPNDNYDFNQLCDGLIKDINDLSEKITSIKQANIELNFVENNKKGFLLDLLIMEVESTMAGFTNTVK